MEFFCASSSAARNGVSASTVGISASGLATCPTVKCCRSRMRLIIACSSSVNAWPDSRIIARISSRLPNSRPVKVRPPVHFKIVRDTSATSSTTGLNRKLMTRNGQAADRHSEFGCARKSIFGSRSKNA